MKDTSFGTQDYSVNMKGGDGDLKEMKIQSCQKGGESGIFMNRGFVKTTKLEWIG